MPVRNFPPHSVASQWKARRGLFRTWGGGDRASPADWQWAPYRWRAEQERRVGEDNTKKKEKGWVRRRERRSSNQTSIHSHYRFLRSSSPTLGACFPGQIRRLTPPVITTIITHASAAAPRWASAEKGARGSSPRWLAISIASSWERSPKVGTQKNFHFQRWDVCLWVHRLISSGLLKLAEIFGWVFTSVAEIVCNLNRCKHSKHVHFYLRASVCIHLYAVHLSALFHLQAVRLTRLWHQTV